MSSLAVGLAVPIPTLPLVSIRIRSVLFDCKINEPAEFNSTPVAVDKMEPTVDPFLIICRTVWVLVPVYVDSATKLIFL